MSNNTCTIKEYIRSKSSLDAKIAAIQTLISNMWLDTIDEGGDTADWITNGGTAEYSMDEGQMKVSTKHRSVEEVIKGIKSLEQMLQMYINQRNGRLTVLRGRLNY